MPWAISSRMPASTCVRVAAAALGITRASEAAEDLAADRVIPVPEGCPGDQRPGCPGAAPEDLIFRSEKDFRVLGVGERLVVGVRLEVARGPLPDIANHAVAANRRDVPEVGANRRRAERQLVDIRN